jgi:sulfonate transport system substrate-binding protein
MRPTIRALLAVVFGHLLPGCDRGAEPAAQGEIVLRVGHFPNVTHAQGLVAHALSRKGDGWFEKRLGPGVKIEWFVYNAGPSAMEAVFTSSVDLTYVGPSPALNAYMRTRGEEVRAIRGAALGGSALVVQGDGGINAPEDFRGKRIATPQFGNTQDVACRAWLISRGFRVTQQGGDVIVLPTANPDQLDLFVKKSIDAVWTVEPWVSRLVSEGKGRVFLEEPEALTTILVARVRFLKEQKELARKFAQAHAELTEWMEKNPTEAQKLILGELEAETKTRIAPQVVESAWARLKFTAEISKKQLEECVAAARSVGFLKDAVDLSRLVEEP